MKRYEYDRRFGFVLLTVDEGDRMPSAADVALAASLEDAIKAGDPNVEIAPCDRYEGCVDRNHTTGVAHRQRRRVGRRARAASGRRATCT
jgi:hypothetical protein